MEFLTSDGTRKAGLTERKRGKGGTVVRLVVDPMTVAPIRNTAGSIQRDTYVVKDLYARRSYLKPDQIAIGPEDLGVAFSVSMCDVEVVR